MLIAARPRRASGRTAALAALTVAGTVLIGVPGTAAAAPGDNGDIKIHDTETDPGVPADEPKVCKFYLDAVNFDEGETFTWTIDGQGQGPNAGTGHLSGNGTTDGNGAAHTEDLTLSDGLYKVVWKGGNWTGAGKQKVFTVDCTSPTPTPTSTRPGGGPGGPNGGPPAGGGGLAKDAAMGPVAGAAVVGLAAAGGAVWLRLRRRPHGA
ncbi:hypothetical protein [Streptomyces justiciae]|uniref:LPXTG cell wall anchor domain-containing protein n=1 Tax=Streptomyces justiciae TaxID=2780140 RepID=A0ABU3LYS2_9ACTN|nr:hypothetical protein [Streptomyces justiciae]MDT7844400.1 hypothetical protein [Streptomyces justiciae]